MQQQPGVSHHALSLAIGGEQLRHLALKTVAVSISRQYRYRRVHDVRASRGQVAHKSNRQCIVGRSLVIECAQAWLISNEPIHSSATLN